MSEPGTEPGTEIAVIERTLRTDRDAYFADPHMSGRYAELLRERDGGTPAPAKSPHAEEIAQIEKVLRGDRDQYWANTPDAVKRRERYRELLSVAEVEGEESWRASPDRVRQALPALAAEWGRDFDANLVRAQDAIMHVLQGIGDEETAADFLFSTNQFSENAQTAIFREAAMGPPTYVKPADEHEIESFKLLDGGREFLKAWGNEAPRRVATVYERFNRLVASMIPADGKQFREWFWLITSRERSAIIWALAS